ncbi:Protein OCTOPUS-like [Arabidopsis suecica]|uniref:Protein OCTOPUS-like n=1 Tax=Arabidopsis suecica TaxID=45249 RepID=A0A8T1Y0L5_ARASU|nr:Protein OCTOPUS-like [Arabidopsis suecica]
MTHQTHQRRRRRHSAVCHRHPTSKPTTGFCATCLRERLSTIEALSSSVSASTELRRVRSYSIRDASASVLDQPRRRSCDVRSNDGDDELLQSSIRFPIVPDLKEDDEEEEDGEEIRGFDDGKRLVEEEIEDGEQKTMKELIDLESRNQQIKKSNGKGRISFEEPRASWDGCLIGKTYPKLIPLSSVTEDVKASPEKITGEKEDEEEKNNPGGTAQTRDYYLDSRRRRSFDRSSRHGLLEVDELKAISNAKVSPETVRLFHGAKLLVTERELRDSNWYSIKNYKPESLELGSEGVGCVAAGDVKKQDGFGLKKTGKKWAKGWNFWGLIQRKTDTNKNEIKTEQSLKLGGNTMEGSLAESLLKLRRVAKGETNGDVSEKLIRSYSVSARKSCDGMLRGASIVNGFEGGRSSCDGLFHGSITGVETGRRSSCENGLFHGVEGKHNHLLQRDDKLGTYSPDNLRKGMVRFYLTPLNSHTTSKSGKSRLMN